jgi:chromosome segregation ATPase
MGEKTEAVSRMAFLEEENRRLAEDRERLKEERRAQDENRWAELKTNIASISANVSSLTVAVTETRTEIREATRSSTALKATIEDVKESHERTLRLLASPDEPEKGLVYRVRQNEERHSEHIAEHKEARKWWIGIGMVAISTAFKTAWDVVFKKP